MFRQNLSRRLIRRVFKSYRTIGAENQIMLDTVTIDYKIGHLNICVQVQVNLEEGTQPDEFAAD
jgi:hypothetical protein